MGLVIIIIVVIVGILLATKKKKADMYVRVKSRQTLEKYDAKKFFSENKEKLNEAERIINEKKEKGKTDAVYTIRVQYVSPSGRSSASKDITIEQQKIDMYKKDPSLLMGKGEYSKFLKDQQKKELAQKHQDYYGEVSSIIDYANENKDSLVIKNSQKELDNLIARLFDRTVNGIKKIKTTDSEEWDIIGGYVADIKCKVEKIVNENAKILEYYDSSDFLKIKETCNSLMESQREFNEYIAEKVDSISQLFGTRVVRNETINDDENNYVRPYKKTITPFTAEVSAAVFASAENNPLEYVVKYFYPSKAMYPDQIRKLYRLVEELQTLGEAKQIIENYKAEYQQYLGDVPAFIMNNDEDGFYSRLGFTIIDESVLAVEYKFSYTSGGGMAQRSFTIPMTEETIAELIKVLESKLTAGAFAKEQRTLMTKKLREHIKIRDHFTCCNCGNSTNIEPNLLLEIDHMIPIAKGGRTEESNLQTLCWKCNRSKSDKLIF